uniref:SIAH-type domain-containing protein n=1 Tax=Cuerna arida TaxID=1464854 RepID=A0A1B6H4F6_9HEMI
MSAEKVEDKMKNKNEPISKPNNAVGEQNMLAIKLKDKTTPTSKPSTAVNVEYNCTELFEALKYIQSAVECYSCHKPLRSARVCLNGHGVCPTCKNRFNWKCPICKAYITDTKPVMLDQIIKRLPRTCKFFEKGCKSLVLVNDNDHETFCRYRQTECRVPCCHWRGLAGELLQHLETAHTKELVRTYSQSYILMSFNTKVNKEGLLAIIAYNNIFWQHVRVRAGRLVQFYQYVPIEKPKEKFSVMISFHTPETNYSSTIPVHSDAFNFRSLFKDRESFHLPIQIALSFSKFHSGVHYSMEIIKKPL